MNRNIAIAHEALTRPLFGQQRKYKLYINQILNSLVDTPVVLFDCQTPYGKYLDHRCVRGAMTLRGWDLRYVFVDRLASYRCQVCRVAGYSGDVAAHPFFYPVTLETIGKSPQFKIEWQKLWVEQQSLRVWTNFFNILSLEA